MSLKLDHLQKAADRKYADYIIANGEGEDLVFENPMRRPREARRKLARLFDLEAMEKRAQAEPDLDLYDLYREAFQVSAKKPLYFEQLDEAVGDNPAMWEELIAEYQKQCAPGEAAPSES